MIFFFIAGSLSLFARKSVATCFAWWQVEVLIPLEGAAAPLRKINLVVRTFNDGTAFRYEVLAQLNWESYVMYDENTIFNLVDDP